MKTDRDQILQILKERGSRGVHSLELVHLVTPRAAARIEELANDEGWQIDRKSEKRGNAWGVRYTLLTYPDQSKQRKLIFEGNLCREVWV